MFSLDKQNAEKRAFVDKAKSEREKRELQRVKQKQEQKHAQAVDVIQTTYKKHCQRKKDVKHLRELWDIDVLYTNDKGSNPTFSISSTEVLGFSYLMFAFFNPSDDAKDLSRFSHLCKMILSTTTPSTPAKSQTQKTLQSVAPFHSLLLNERYKVLMLKIMKKILWQCVICVTGSLNETNALKSSKPLYLSGPELRLLIYFLDPKNYIAKGTIASYSSMWSQQLVILYDYLIHQGFYKQIGYGMMLRVNSILSFQSRAVKAELMDNDKKLLKSTHLWLIACLRCCLFSLDLNNDVDMTLNNLQSLKMSKNNLQDRSVNNLNNFICYILTIPCLISCFDEICLGMFKTYNILSRAIHTMCIPDIVVNILQMITGNDTIFLAGNMVELMSRIDTLSLPNNKVETTFHNFIESIIFLLQHCQKYVSTKQSNTHYQYHPVFTWYSGTTDPNISTSHFNRLIIQLEYLWQKPFLLRSFNHVLNFKFDSQLNNNLDSSKIPSQKKTLIDKNSSLTSNQITLLAVETQDICRLYLMLSKLLIMQKHDIMMNLIFLPRLVPTLWQFMMCLGPKGRMKIFLSETVVKEPGKEPLIGILELFCEICGILLLTIDDNELYEIQTSFSIEHDLRPMATFFNKICFALLSNSSPDGNPPAIFESARRVLLQLHSRDTRRVFTGPDHTWLLIKDPKKSLPLSLANFLKKSVVNSNSSMGTSFLERIRSNDPISVKILNLLPHTIPFETRLDIFREFLQTDDFYINDSSDIVIKIRRDHVLEDGYKQLGRLTATQIKGRIRVMFVNETGMDEIGVDQGGPFKEFITQLMAEAFDPKCGFFAVTPDGSLYPNPHSTSTKLPLYTFLGRMIARAMKEKILLDSQFAEFFLSKISGRAVFLEDLIGWNDELWKNLIFLKRYEGNVEDLGLFFVIDEEINGQITSKELKSGGSHMTVTNYNKIQYIYLVADYKLNKQIKEQTEAFINGFQSMIPINRLRMFSPPELQRVMSGEDVNWDIADLRKHTIYQSGYFDQHKTIRTLWSILEEFGSKDKNAFLKFVTSCSRPPLGGFKYLQPPFTIRMVSMEYDDSDSRPVLAPVKAFFSFGNSKSAAKGRLPTSSTW
ncbi:4050_t:CDS:10 [Cetraspora pellucida]|uniref:HECT-type E3 ubiquitin transferase n=1 Tax=Cetraspora pellucida TaxID=1433469 RepID=A0A9N9A346_9GLOM|nr:4050_t:CDS:10 [Cetraspora pellucida]